METNKLMVILLFYIQTPTLGGPNEFEFLEIPIIQLPIIFKLRNYQTQTLHGSHLYPYSFLLHPLTYDLF